MLKRIPRISTARIVLVVTAVIVGYFVVTGATAALQSSNLREREDRLRAEIIALQQRHDRLEALKAFLSSDEYIEAVAREQLGLVREGETSIVVISAAPTEGEENGEEPDDLWWQALSR